MKLFMDAHTARIFINNLTVVLGILEPLNVHLDLQVIKNELYKKNIHTVEDLEFMEFHETLEVSIDYVETMLKVLHLHFKDTKK